jgi:hypothetical protein
MTQNDPAADRQARPPSRGGALLERITACVLVLVLLALGWMLVVSYDPDWLRLASLPAPLTPEEPLKAEVIGVLVLVSVALGFVAIVALLHTRRR